MKKLEPHKQIAVSPESVSRILAWYGIADFTFEPISEGIANTSLIIDSGGKKYVLRVYAQGTNTNEDISFELGFQDYLRGEGIPVPFVYTNKDANELTLAEVEGKTWQAILMKYIEGESVTETHPPELIGELARMQAKMHLLGSAFGSRIQSTKEPWTELRDGHAQDINNPFPNDGRVVAFIERVKAFRYPLNPNLPSGFNHLDIDFDGNVIVKDNHVNGIIDFEDVSYTPSIVCLGFSLWNLLDHEGADATRLYVREYEKVRPLTALEREVLPNVILARNYLIGSTRLLLWDEATPRSDIDDILRLEKEIPALTF